MYENISFDNQNTKFLFSFSFAVLSVYLLQQYAFLMVIFNLIYLPFNLAHELGHFFAISYFLPMINPEFEIYLVKEGVCSCKIPIEQLPPSWESVISKLAGSLVIILFSTIGILVLRKRKDQYSLIGRNFLIFGLFIDLPNLFPILPSMFGSVNDGYSISIILLRMGFSTYPSVLISFIFSCLTVILFLISFYYLGCFIYHLLTFPGIKLRNELNLLIESHKI